MSKETISEDEPIFHSNDDGSRRLDLASTPSGPRVADASVKGKVPPPLPFLSGTSPAQDCETPATLSAAADPIGKRKSAFHFNNDSMDKPLAAESSVTRSKSISGATGAPGNHLAKNVEPDSSCSDDDVSLDSYGIPRYEVRYPDGGQGSHGDVSVPWNLRPPQRRMNCTFFDSLRTPQFWRQFEFATRITAVAVLVPGALIAADLPGSPFVSTFMVFSSTVLAAKRTSGEAVAYIFSWIRAGCFWLPLAAIAGALNLGHHMAGWCIYYTFCLFIMAAFTEGIQRRICLLLFNSCTVGFLVNPSRNALYPCRVMVDWSIGTALCVVAAFFPYPLFCKREAQRLLRDIARNTATAYRGLVYSFWSLSNVERNMAMSKVHLMTDSLDELLPLFEHYQSFSFYEFFFETPEVRDIRALKFSLFERLRINLSSMTRVLDMVEAKPSAIDDSDRSKAFGELLNPHLNAVAEAFDELLDLLSHAKTRSSLMDLQERFTYFADRTDELQDAYKLARRMLFYEHTSDVLEEFVPLMTFYLFTVVCVRDTVDIFKTKVNGYKPSVVGTMKQIFIKTTWEPFMENVNFVRTLFKRWNRREVQRVIEAAKVSGAMILTIGFSYLIKIDMPSFSGPNIIAFVSGSNPVEAVQESIVRLTGCLLGTVLGFFAGTYSKTPVQRVASLCTLMFCGTFLRFDKEYGIMAIYGMFVLIPLDSITPTTMDDTVQRMNQNTFGIFIYLFVSALVLPLSPSLILRAKRSNVLRCMSNTITSMMELFSVPLVTDLKTAPFRTQMDDTDDDPPTQGASTNEHAPPHRQLSNCSVHMMSKTDTALQEIDKQLADVLRRLKGTKDVMKFARDERTLVEVDYPIKSCEQTYTHMYRMAMLLKTMWMSWNVIRSQRVYTADTRHMMRNLQPVARDVAGAFQRFVDLMCYMMREPAINLEGEIMKAVLDLIEACDVLHRRKSQIMLMLINQSVHDYIENLDPNDPLFQRDQPSATDQPLQPDLSERQHSHHHTHGSIDLEHSHRQHTGFDFQHASRRAGLPRSHTFDNGFHHFTPIGSPSTQGYSFQVLASERNVSVTPFLPKTSPSTSAKREACSPTGPVRLPSTFVFPVTSEDAEGMHSFTLSLEVFANETKLLMMSLGAMLDNLRSKL
ncbi:hypothetical protein ABB37_00590 [Leptomonas pyrrhocoris]|uniref:Integral membrane bound transporter domain-containing protein n=1 Tax=Leptomonas pyrrhocoris TaxID=157538 RepID=A0A0N0E0G1_LEPPY|nr:hypothetical protein ABB37_00590 [Leptomonas pyrrhocoris]XP_015664855.1 hypothetical protein ABB37_00590 [Leptomonas pyrrhocoris]KPA86415.1 hypothetical protein ABB37_00590 [Leptomonas pyrrhocoris]KPA86416.1 hypothetical protein ABB37_00590 [Leptomonas pyrrhocoris]|eukprot:XP_015664854.1 hypothetical protein ABB37_00590 [Leptomonas pyrrhocoris]